MRLGDHMMFIQLQLSTQTGARRARPTPVQLPTPHNMTVHDHQEVPSPTFTSEAGSNGIPYNLHQFRSFPESEKVRRVYMQHANIITQIISLFDYTLCVINKAEVTEDIVGKHVFLLSIILGAKNFIVMLLHEKGGGGYLKMTSKRYPSYQLILLLFIFLRGQTQRQASHIQHSTPITCSSCPHSDPLFVSLCERCHGAVLCLQNY